MNLVTLGAISNGALASASLPTRIKVLNWGDNPSTQGTLTVNEVTVQAMALDQDETGLGKVAIDYQHNTVPGSPEYERTREPRDVAGYGVPEVVRKDGLYLSNLEWTPSGKASAKNYADLSPSVYLDQDRRVILLHSVALVRNGAVFGLSFFEAGAAGETVERERLIARFAAEGKVPLEANGQPISAAALAACSIDFLKLLHANTRPRKGQFDHLKGLEKAIAAARAQVGY